VDTKEEQDIYIGKRNGGEDARGIKDMDSPSADPLWITDGEGKAGKVVEEFGCKVLLPLWPHRFPHFGYIHLGGGGVGALFKQWTSFYSV
jgi:hypothetical protein